jgi:hypothetical protein
MLIELMGGGFEPTMCFHVVTTLTMLIELMGGGLAGKTAPFAVMCPGQLLPGHVLGAPMSQLFLVTSWQVSHSGWVLGQINPRFL